MSRRPMLLVAPNWLGATKDVIERAMAIAGDRYVAFVADMFGEGKGPKGTANPMEFLAPLIGDTSAHLGGLRGDIEGSRSARHRRHQAARRDRLLLRRLDTTGARWYSLTMIQKPRSKGPHAQFLSLPAWTARPCAQNACSALNSSDAMLDF